MSDGTFREVAEEHWAALEAEPTSGERRLRVSQLPVVTEQGALVAAVDHDGFRHVLVPVHSHLKIRSGLDGPVLHLSKRPLEDEETYQTYADLACLRTDLNDLFTELCADILDATGKLPKNPVKALYGVIDRWKALFQPHRAVLGPEQLAGLFGELLVLERLLQLDSSAYRLWRGPDGHHHDFTTGSLAVEVKTGAKGEGRRPRVHGLDQLEAPQDGTLCLAWFGLHRTFSGGSGLGFLELLERTLRSCDDESALIELLAQAGYRPVDAERYRDVRFVVDEQRWYEVTPDFPALTNRALAAAGVPISVLDVEYTIDLSGESPVHMAPDVVSRMIDRMIQESA
ncbi:PD-(D/E)XK motif protein [Streptomyces olivochromogenes]|uniref:PD-(D/E)XK motif protein n=1 Tax=Streptomyces olivochromogenes TaxID=1963 RepID=UPI001F4831FF|nr:PD-(D/E)XK motif protein [Streptomyces olivochromogenes]MCF3135136.1 PD-(D/E)XK motif protein [Streptomyces olivochromogenes]